MDAKRDVRVYNERMSSDGCWEMQVSTCTSWKLHIRILTTHIRYRYLLVPRCVVLFCHQIGRTSCIDQSSQHQNESVEQIFVTCFSTSCSHADSRVPSQDSLNALTSHSPPLPPMHGYYPRAPQRSSETRMHDAQSIRESTLLFHPTGLFYRQHP